MVLLCCRATLVAAICVGAAVAASRWGEQQAYLDPGNPPAWVTSPLQAPAVPLNPPPPLPPSMVAPAEPDLVAAGPALFVAQEPPPFHVDAGEAPLPDMRPLTLLDAKGGEYRGLAPVGGTAPAADKGSDKAPAKS